MTYLALARKWRPRSFADVAGQTHVVRALQNALDSGRIHHAFLFTGTRGVGKTTIARILVKALNCERGPGSTPCGECSACQAIDAGRFVDFLELDAASRTGVDDTRELLESAQYTPASGRFKVYLIDEVHMLSRSAFNALLKTLEEPPPHVKFLLATTDPQKVPVTVLSRCLQFNLKRLPLGVIADRLRHICGSEGVAAEEAAIQRLARAADGSLRDSLSLLDQALAYGNGRLTDRETAEMLGTMDRGRLRELLLAVAAGDAPGLMALARRLDELAPDYEDVLTGLATQFQQVALIQVAGREAVADAEEPEVLAQLAGTLSPEFVQLLYQIAIGGRRDLGLAPEPRLGFEMTLLRMLAFRPGVPEGQPVPADSRAGPVRSTGPAAAPAGEASAPDPGVRPVTAGPGPDPANWPAFVATLPLEGAARQLAAHTALVALTPFEIQLRVEPANGHLLTDKLRARVTAALQDRLGGGLRVQIALRGGGTADTAAARDARQAEEALRRAREAIATDSNVRELAELLGAEVVPDSVRPVAGHNGKR